MLDLLNYVLIWGFIWGSIYLGLALGFSIIVGVLRVFHMGFGIFFVLAVYLTWTFWKVAGLDLWLSIVVAVLCTSGLSLIFYPVIKKFMDFEDYLLMSLVLIFLIGEEIMNHIYPIETGVYLPTLLFKNTVNIGYVTVTEQYLFLSLASLLIFSIYVVFLKFTKYGLIIRAITQDLNTARLFGVNIPLSFLTSLAISVIPSAIIIIFYSPLTRIDPFMGFPLFIWALQVAILGGLGNLKGTLMAAYVIGYIHAFVGYVINPRAMNLASLIAIIVILLFRPRGLARAESIW
ncbi:MAG: branched-chain amino acid ABC transporter permease [Pyrobaculum sp.]